MILTLGQVSQPVVFREGAVCPEGYLCVPGVPPIKLPDVQGAPAQPEWSIPWNPDLGAIGEAGFDPSIFDWSTGLLKT